MIHKSLILKMFDAFSIQRWNDKIRPVVLTEMDKVAHKMVIAYCLARYEEDAGKEVDWIALIHGGVFELLRRVVISDIKSPVFRKIQKNKPEIYKDLNNWVFDQLSPCLGNEKTKHNFKLYLQDTECDTISKQILVASHIYASYWEFCIIKNANPGGYDIEKIDKLMLADIDQYLFLEGVKKLITKQNIKDFIDLVGQLRFQIRWGHTPRIPATSVLGHSMMVAALTFLFSEEIETCPRRIRNNFFGGLFHDLPEAVTRDIISPVKRSVEGLDEAIGQIEKELVEKEIYPLIEQSWISEFQYFTVNEFASKIQDADNTNCVSSEEISKTYNCDNYNPIDGEIIKIADHLAAFVEAYQAIRTGITTPQLWDGLSLKTQYSRKIICGMNIGSIYADFD